MTRFVITGQVRDTGVLNRLNEDMVQNPSSFNSQLKSLNLVLDHTEKNGDDVVYYLRESKGPKILCD